MYIEAEFVLVKVAAGPNVEPLRLQELQEQTFHKI